MVAGLEKVMSHAARREIRPRDHWWKKSTKGKDIEELDLNYDPDEGKSEEERRLIVRTLLLFVFTNCLY